MLNQASSVEVRHEWLRRSMGLIGGIVHRVVKDVVLKILARIEILVNGINLGKKCIRLFVCITHRTESLP